MNDAAVDELGSVDYLVVEFPADKADFLGAMAAELSALVGRGVVHVLDLLILKRDLDGSLEVSRYPDQLPQSLLQPLGEHSLTIDRLSDRYFALHGGSSFDLAGSPVTLGPEADGPEGPPSPQSSTSPGATSRFRRSASKRPGVVALATEHASARALTSLPSRTMFDSDIGGGDETLAFSEDGEPGSSVACSAPAKAPLPLGTEWQERVRDRCGRLLRQLKQRSRRSMRRHRSAMEAATIQNWQRHRWLPQPDNLGSAAPCHSTARLV